MLPFFEWCEGSALGQVVRTSTWMFPIIESMHLLGLCALGGTVLVVDWRMLGGGLRRATIAELAADVAPWLRRSVLVLVGTGIPLFLSEAVKCYYSTSYWVKMVALVTALAFTWTVRARTVRAATQATPRTRTVAIVSIGLWFVVAAAGRWIGFSS